jgi:phosphomevalonate kinase
MTTVETVTLSDCGVALILLENELNNNIIAIRRWSRRLTEAETELQELTKQRHMLTEALNNVKESI